MSVQYRNECYENFFTFSSYFIFLHHSQTLVIDAMTVLFLEFPDMQLHYDPMFDSLYTVGSCHFHLYFFSHRDFAIPLFHPGFDPSIPYFAIPLHVAHPAPPQPPAAPATLVAFPLAPPPQVVLVIPLGLQSDSFEPFDSPFSSSGPNAGYIPAGLSMANGYLSEQTLTSKPRCTVGPSFDSILHWAMRVVVQQ